MDKHSRRAAISGLCALVIGLGSMGAGASAALAQPAQSAAAQSAAASSTTAAAKTTSNGYTLTDIAGSSAAQKAKADTTVKEATTPKKGAPDFKEVQELPSTISSDNILKYQIASETAGKDGYSKAASDEAVRNPAGTVAPKAAADGKATLELTPKSVTHEQLAAKRAIVIHAAGFTPGEAIKYEVTPPDDPSYNFTEYFAGYADKKGRWLNTISYLNPTYARKGDYTVKLTGLKSGASVEDKYTITDDPAKPTATTAKITTDRASISQSDMRWSGIKYTVSGFKPNEEVTVSVIPSLGDAQTLGTATTDANGEFTKTVTSATAVGLTGTFQFVASGEQSGIAMTTFKVVANDDPYKDSINKKAPDTAKLTIDPKRISQYAIAMQGLTLTVTGFQKDEQVQFIVTDPDTGFQRAWSMIPVTYPKPVEGSYYSPMYDTSLQAKPGTYAVKVVGSKSGYVTGSYEVYDDTSIKIDPKVEPTGEMAKHYKDGVVTYTQSEILKDGAISFKATGYVPGDYAETTIINPNGTQMQGVSGLTGDDGTYVDDGSHWSGQGNFGNVSGYGNAIVPGNYTLIVADHYAKSRIYSQINIKVTDDSTTADRGSVKLDPTDISAMDFYKTGVKLNITGFKANELGSISIVASDGSHFVATPLMLNANGAYQGTLKVNSPELAQHGKYTVAFYTNDANHAKQEGSFTVNDEQPAPTIDVKLSADQLTQDDFTKTGLTLDATGLSAFQWGDVHITLPDGHDALVFSAQADGDGNFSRTEPLKWSTDAAQPGTYKVHVQTADYHYGDVAFTVTGDKTTGVDKSELQQLVDKVSDLKQSDYTADSWAGLAEPLAAAQAVLGKATATQAEVNTAWVNLSDAIDALVPATKPAPDVDKTELQTLVDKAGSYDEAKYTAKSWAEFTKALANARAVLADAKATQPQVNAATNALKAAIAALVEKSTTPTPNPNPGETPAPTPGATPGKGGQTTQQLGKTGASVSLMAVGALLTAAGATVLLRARANRKEQA